MFSFPNLEPVCCSMFSSNCCFLTCIQISQEAGKGVWYPHLFQNFPQIFVIYTVKGFGIVNKAEVDVFLVFSCFSDDPMDVGNLISLFIWFIIYITLNARNWIIYLYYPECKQKFWNGTDYYMCSNKHTPTHLLLGICFASDSSLYAQKGVSLQQGRVILILRIWKFIYSMSSHHTLLLRQKRTYPPNVNKLSL